MQDFHYQNFPYAISLQKHYYGENVYLISDRVLITLLARLCSPLTIQPQINWLVSYLYHSLVEIVINSEFPTVISETPTRMIEHNKEGVYFGQILDPETKVVLVDLARAGILPTLSCFEYFNNVLTPKNIRLDHIFINRTVNDKQQVTGVNVSGHKIGGEINDAFVIFPDPMGATGSSISNAVNVYKQQIKGTPKKMIAIHLIITPEYIKRIKKQHPDLILYGIRLDRGLSSEKVLKAIPGTYWDEEKGLNEHQYIVPGGGGFGEILNNSFV